MKWVLAWLVVGIAVQLIQYMRTTQSVGYRAYHAALRASGVSWRAYVCGILAWPVALYLMLTPSVALEWAGDDAVEKMDLAVDKVRRTFCPRCDQPWLTHRGQMCPPAQK